MRMRSKMAALNEMIVNALADSGKLTIAEYTKRMYSHSPLEHLWDRNILTKPVQRDTTKTVKDSTKSNIIPEKVDSVKDSIHIQRPKVPQNSPNLRSKPVLRPKDRPMIVQ